MSDPAAPAVTLVIPGKNASRTLRPCLDAVVPLLNSEELAEIIFVDDGSTDDTAAIAAGYPVRVIKGTGGGPGYARNLGWREARTPLVWFIDSDCVAQPDALKRLLPHLPDEKVAGVSGLYENVLPEFLLSCLIHEEIVERHRWMPTDVNYLAAFNVLYRKDVLEQVSGFNEFYRTAEDCELSFRVQDAGYTLRFEIGSRVGHYHPTRLSRYLRAQAIHGYFRVWLYLHHRTRAGGDAYSGLVDHVQPPLAMLLLLTLPLAFWWPWSLVPAAVFGLLLLAQVPMTVRLVQRMRQPKYTCFIPMSLVRAFGRGFGMSWAVLRYLFERRWVPDHAGTGQKGEATRPGTGDHPHGREAGGSPREIPVARACRIRSLTTPAVSVLMPVLNPHPRYFPEAVRSVLNQTFGDLELIIVEAPSPGSAANLLALFSDSRIRHIANPERTSLPAQLNQGLAECRGHYIARMDADDICEPARLEEQLDYLQQNPELAVLGSQITVIDDAGTVIGCRDYPCDHATILRSMERFNPLAHPTVMFARDAVLGVGGYRAVGGGVEDYDLWSRLAKRGARFGNFPEALLRYRIHDHSMKSAGLRRMLLHTLKVKRRHWLSEMSFKGRIRLAAEQLLTLLPPEIVLRLFMASILRPTDPRMGQRRVVPCREWQ